MRLSWENVVKKCKNCNKNFVAKNKKHYHCSRQCYLESYNEKKKSKELPKFICPNCRKDCKLKFNPLLKPMLWSKFKCSCGWTNTENDYKETVGIKRNWGRYNTEEREEYKKLIN